MLMGDVDVLQDELQYVSMSGPSICWTDFKNFPSRERSHFELCTIQIHAKDLSAFHNCHHFL